MNRVNTELLLKVLDDRILDYRASARSCARSAEFAAQKIWQAKADELESVRVFVLELSSG